MYVISAHVAGFGCDKRIVCCFDPSVVVVRLREAFPEMEIVPEEIAWRDHNLMKQHGSTEGAMQIARNDAYRRGPIWLFRLPNGSGPPIHGKSERYDVRIWSDEPIPELLRSRMLAFLEELRFSSCVEIKSVRDGDDDEVPAGIAT
jgi:hypothetical protein